MRDASSSVGSRPRTIGDTPGNGTANQAHCRCRTEHDPEFSGPEPASRKKGR
jgi:hypothetical protein